MLRVLRAAHTNYAMMSTELSFENEVQLLAWARMGGGAASALSAQMSHDRSSAAARAPRLASSIDAPQLFLRRVV
jgi:hypothetical protein